jgi:flagellar FliL protein
MANHTLASAPATADVTPPQKKSKKKLMIMVLGALLVAGAAYYMLVMKPAAAAATAGAAPVKPKPAAGLVIKLDPIYINLTSGHFLKLGLALQGSAAATKELDGSKALDAAISEFSGKDMATVGDAKTRDALKKDLTAKVTALYENDEVLDIYFTEFVMQ